MNSVSAVSAHQGTKATPSAPTILSRLGMDPLKLQIVVAERTQSLRGI